MYVGKGASAKRKPCTCGRTGCPHTYERPGTTRFYQNHFEDPLWVVEDHCGQAVESATITTRQVCQIVTEVELFQDGEMYGLVQSRMMPSVVLLPTGRLRILGAVRHVPQVKGHGGC